MSKIVLMKYSKKNGGFSSNGQTNQASEGFKCVFSGLVRDLLSLNGIDSRNMLENPADVLWVLKVVVVVECGFGMWGQQIV